MSGLNVANWTVVRDGAMAVVIDTVASQVVFKTPMAEEDGALADTNVLRVAVYNELAKRADEPKAADAPGSRVPNGPHVIEYDVDELRALTEAKAKAAEAEGADSTALHVAKVARAAAAVADARKLLKRLTRSVTIDLDLVRNALDGDPQACRKLKTRAGPF